MIDGWTLGKSDGSLLISYTNKVELSSGKMLLYIALMATQPLKLNVPNAHVLSGVAQ